MTLRFILDTKISIVLGVTSACQRRKLSQRIVLEGDNIATKNRIGLERLLVSEPMSKQEVNAAELGYTHTQNNQMRGSYINIQHMNGKREPLALSGEENQTFELSTSPHTLHGQH